MSLPSHRRSTSSQNFVLTCSVLNKPTSPEGDITCNNLEELRSRITAALGPSAQQTSQVSPRTLSPISQEPETLTDQLQPYPSSALQCSSSISLPTGPAPSPEIITDAAKTLAVLNSTISDDDIRHFYAIVKGQLLAPSIVTNQNQWPIIVNLTDKHLAYSQTMIVNAYGHCQYLKTRTGNWRGPIIETVKLTEGGKNNDSPRTSMLTGTGGQKIYIYHILARYVSITNPTVTINTQRLQGVSVSKNDKLAYTILHLCGHKWCMNERHLDIAPKRLNDEQTDCHRGLESATSVHEMEGIRKFYCKHKIRGDKCWTINYAGVWAPQHEWTRHS